MSDPVPTPPGASPVSPAPKSRFVRTVGIAALALALSFLGLLNVVASAPVIRDSLGPLVWEHRVVSDTAVFVTLAVTLLVPVVALIFCSRRGWLRWPQLTALWVVVFATLAYLAWDDP